jgi:hypothetical protein
MTEAAIRKTGLPLDEDRCRSIGNILVGLHYLSGQARLTNVPELARTIDEAIASAALLGSDVYHSQLPDNDSAEKAFIENYCPVDDETVKYELREIVYKQSLSRKMGSF